MTTGKQDLICACQLSGLDVVADYEIVLSDNASLICDVYIRNLVDDCGMAVFHDSSVTVRHGKQLSERGIGYSSWDLHSKSLQPFDLSRYQDILREWGWAGDQVPPRC